MKKKHIYSLIASYLLTAACGTLPSCTEQTAPTATHTPKKRVKKIYVYKRPELTVRTDTLNVSTDNIQKIKKSGAAGVFFSGTNTVVVYHFNPISNNTYIQKWCERNNNQSALTTRHELEHARKAYLTRNTEHFSAIGRAQIAAMNEIIAPASEIIEAMDYRAHTGQPYPYAKDFITKADSAITATIPPYMLRYVNYDYPPVADAIITYATEGFLAAVNRGYYKHTIKKAYTTSPKPNMLTSEPNNIFLFNPDKNSWDPIWEFESTTGKCNPYKAASQTVRLKLMQTVDSVVYSCTDTDYFSIFYKNGFSR